MIEVEQIAKELSKRCGLIEPVKIGTFWGAELGYEMLRRYSNSLLSPGEQYYGGDVWPFQHAHPVQKNYLFDLDA